MPHVPASVLYYGPPNMKVNPSDIKVLREQEQYLSFPPQYLNNMQITTEVPYNPYVR